MLPYISWEMIVMLGLFNVPTFVVIWLMFFGDWTDYRKCLYYSWSPLFLDYMKDELVENFDHNFKLTIFHIICGVVVGVQYYLIAKYDPAVITWAGPLF